MRVWLVQTGEPVPISGPIKRMRTALLADELATRGHQVTWWTSSFDHGSRRFIEDVRPTQHLENGVELRLLPALGYDQSISFRRYFDHHYVARNFRKEIRDISRPPDLIVAATPDYHIAAEAADYAIRNNIPYVVDLRDEWPDSIVQMIPTEALRVVGQFALSYDFWKLRKTLKRATGLVSMMQSMLEWGLSHARREQGQQDRIFYLGTEPPAHPDPTFLVALKEKLGPENKMTVVFIGTFGRMNHPEVILSALEHIAGQATQPQLNAIIVGEGDLYATVRRRYEHLPGVHFTGWLSSPQIASVLELGDIGVIPAVVERATFPNKAFSYLAAGLPILTSGHGDLKDLIEQHKFGKFFEPGNTLMLAKILLYLASNPAVVNTMSQSAQQLYKDRFMSNVIYGEYSDYLESIVSL